MRSVKNKLFVIHLIFIDVLKIKTQESWKQVFLNIVGMGFFLSPEKKNLRLGYLPKYLVSGISTTSKNFPMFFEENRAVWVRLNV